MLRQRLLVLSNEDQEEFKLRKTFASFDTNGSGAITVDELAAMLAKLGISVDRKYIQATLNRIDTNGNGKIEFEEFTNLILYNPYK
jgi:Ca2+-binding EF-hand superfamily protein